MKNKSFVPVYHGSTTTIYANDDPNSFYITIKEKIERMEEGLCANCGLHKGTIKWVGEGGGIALVHGFYEMWCECCVLKEQIKHAEERSAALPGLRKELERLNCQ